MSLCQNKNMFIVYKCHGDNLLDCRNTIEKLNELLKRSTSINIDSWYNNVYFFVVNFFLKNCIDIENRMFYNISIAVSNKKVDIELNAHDAFLE